MESETPSPGPVKGFCEKITHKNRAPGGTASRARILDRRTCNLHFRFSRYCIGAFTEGAHFHYASKLIRSFAHSTKYTEKHLREKMFPAFRRRYAGLFNFQRLRVRRSWQIVITPAGRVQSTGLHLVRARLTGAIRAGLAKVTTCHIDAEFIRKFSVLTSLPLPGCEQAWRELKNCPALRGRWKGEGNSRKFVAVRAEPEKPGNFQSSPPQTSPVISSPTGRIESETAASAGFAQTERAGALPPSTPPAAGWERGADRVQRPETEGPPNRFKPKIPPAAGGRWAALRPFQICGRHIDPRKLVPVALWLASGPIRKIHRVFERVAWDRRHCVNFAMESLLLGYTTAQICSAWRAGVSRSHEDALDRDRLPGGGYLSQRAPSAAKVYAIGAIRAADSRAPEVRWQEFFDAPRRAPAAASPKVARMPAPTRDQNDARPARAFTAAQLREKLAARPRVRTAAPTLGELAALCKARGLTLANFNAKSAEARRLLLASWRHFEGEK